MEARSLSPIQVATFWWQPSSATYARTLVCKLSYELVEGRALLAQEQEPIVMTDEHYDDDPQASIYRPSDRVPFKTRADVVLVGEAYAPAGEPARSVVAELIVRDVHKKVEVYRDRHFNHGGELVEGKRFASMPVRWERARGGELTSNPVGLDPEGERDRYGRLPVPNLQPPGLNVTQIGDMIEPIGFGPTGAFWPWRAALLGRHVDTWDSYYWTERPLPTDIDSSFFNCAPRDQRLDVIQDGERIALLNLHPDTAQLVCHLPGSRPAAFLERGGAAREVELRADTLWIDTTRCVCSVTWRGRIDVLNPDEAGVILVGLQEEGQKLTWSHLKALERGEQPRFDTAPPIAMPVGPSLAAAMPPLVRNPEPPPAFDATPPVGVAVPAMVAPKAVQRTIVPDTADGGGRPAPNLDVPAFMQLPANRPKITDRPVLADLGDAPTPPKGRPRVGTMSIDEGTLVAAMMPSRAALPFQQGSSPPPAQPVSDEMAPSTTPRGGRTQGSMAAIDDHAPPWLRQMLREQRERRDAQSAEDLPTPVPPPPLVHDPIPSTVAAPPSQGLGRLGETMSLRDTQPEIDIPLTGSQVTEPPSVPTPSPTAVGLPIPASPPLASVSGIIELVWASPEAAERARNQPAWSTLLSAGDGLSAAARDEHQLLALLRTAPSEDLVQLRQQMLRATQALAGYRAPLAMLSGQLSFAFDPLDTLKATATVLAPQALGDAKLSGVLRAVSEFLQASWMQSADEAARNLTAQLRGAAPMEDPTVDDQVRRVLISQRAYITRTLFGGAHVVAYLRPDGGNERIPTYISAERRNHLPMFEQLGARALIEAHLRQDQAEGHDVALRVLALGRSVDLSNGIEPDYRPDRGTGG